MSRDPTKTMPIMGHLGELRRRITYIAIAVIVCMIAAFVEFKWVYKVLMYPLTRNTDVTQLSVLGVTEGFMSVLKVSIYAGLIVCLPFILYQFWAFILPGLYENEKRSVIPYTLGTTVLFLGGVVFGYFIVLPVGLSFMVGYGDEMFNMLLRADNYISFVSLFLLAFGIVFELPLVMLLLSWARVVDHRRMRKVRKYAILAEAIIAMVFTPSQDPVSMMLMLIPLIALYEVGILLAKMGESRRAKRDRAAVVAEASGGDADVGDADIGGAAG